MNNPNIKKKVLGRGLGALLQNSDTDITSSPNMPEKPVGSVSVLTVSQIEVNPFQPRTHFDPQALEELSASIKIHGLIQPITVRKLGYDKYQLISGERRFRASQLAGLKEVPAYIRIANDQEMLEMALVENIQRENLDAIEIAISFKRLIDECSLTQEQLSEKVAKQRSTVTNYLRLLKLPPQIQMGIKEGKISMGHARSIINIEDPETQMQIFEEIVENNLSVRDTEEIAKQEKNNTRTTTTTVSKQTTTLKTTTLPFEIERAKHELVKYFNANVDIELGNRGKGKITIPFASEQDLKIILDLLQVS
jgi:ParB family transcriptional regulator, chromosome partitioning protein